MAARTLRRKGSRRVDAAAATWKFGRRERLDRRYDVFITTRYWCLKPVTPLASKHIAFDGVIKPAISAIKREYDARHAGPLFDVHHPHEEKGVVTSC